MNDAEKVLEYFNLLDRVHACGLEVIAQGSAFRVNTEKGFIDCVTIEQLQFFVMGLEATV
jgi:hypothetical protein